MKKIYHFSIKERELDKIVSRECKISLEKLYSKGGKGSTHYECECRAIAWYLRKKILNISFNKSSKKWGYVSHTTVMFAVRNLIWHIETENKLAEKVSLIENIFLKRIDIVQKNKRKYNDQYLLKMKGIKCSTKLKTVSLVSDNNCELILNRLKQFGYTFQYQLNI